MKTILKLSFYQGETKHEHSMNMSPGLKSLIVPKSFKPFPNQVQISLKSQLKISWATRLLLKLKYVVLSQ